MRRRPGVTTDIGDNSRWGNSDSTMLAIGLCGGMVDASWSRGGFWLTVFGSDGVNGVGQLIAGLDFGMGSP